MAVRIDPKLIYEIKVPEGSRYFGEIYRPYAVDVRIGPEHRLRFGRFSSGLVGNLRVLNLPDDTDEVFTCGAFCEADVDARIIVGGNHRNDTPCNITIGSFGGAYALFLSEEDKLTFSSNSRPVRFGDNVVLSSGVRVLGGAEVGTGSVVAAGAVVSGVCPAFGVYGGVPARRLKDRFNAAARERYDALRLSELRAHCIPLIPAMLASDLPSDEHGAEYVNRVPRLVFEGKIGDGGSVHLRRTDEYFIGDDRVTGASIVEKLSSYFNQAREKPASFNWSADIFYDLGIS
ncbi:2,3,4,5-tetrahydropyridine-2,6-dicarboxylate N-acetyltransferase [Methylobacterium adhaesivum]|uniref:Acetyltransferase n=1 Tax=Methylobacterium adhaesivum TaxID=333297 RepID=A0ABT8BGE0_9HYPH|nr:hypothetical protein [Methylobacterium adhaesivum]MDN3590600.1 hypothetical protein [Methylobacterium adhaesivum]GJD30013.1 2,3,4,5-tetrahydropyridine-2,6-dicarboxylate N-acetyltransferase [Methylobacterium adhaesivum]